MFLSNILMCTPPHLNRINFIGISEKISHQFTLQEVLFYEEGEPKVDGEAGDLKV